MNSSGTILDKSKNRNSKDQKKNSMTKQQDSSNNLDKKYV